MHILVIAERKPVVVLTAEVTALVDGIRQVDFHEHLRVLD
jgi:hypothetical protein